MNGTKKGRKFSWFGAGCRDKLRGMTTLKVRFDGRVLVPEEAVDLPQDRVLEIHVLEPARLDAPDGNGAAANEMPQEQKDPDEYPLMALVKALEGLPCDPNLPTDGAAQHDHYLYGTPKRS